ncbi:DUF2637 domain-containing protein [Streptomyces sp. NPDC014623]|uniref:DUF2637 domain-containing protein n=1 Tax=Streptomyces sp. NPDC014623 TaxID=3364875 RepID=UPI0036F7D835
MKRVVDPSRALAIAAGLVIIALTAVAFWLSYAHLAEVALAHGLGQAKARAWAWPATLDLFIVAGELMMLRAALAQRVDWWAIGLTAVGSVGSIVLNVAGVTGVRDPGMVPILDFVVAAVPPAAALLAFGALMRQVHQALAGHGDEEPVTDVVTTKVTVDRADEDMPSVDEEPPAVAARPVIELPAAIPMWDGFTTSKVATAVPAEKPRHVVTEVVTRTPADLRREAARLHRQVVRSGGRGVTIAQLQDELGLSRRDATELRRQVVTEVTA